MNKGTFTKNLNPDTRYYHIYEAVVKDVVDGARQGRLRVWIPEICSVETDPSTWILANYASPFAGSSDIQNINNKIESFEGSQSSYGFWAVPPDTGNIVLVFFANGRSDKCYWFSCTYQQYMNCSVPTVAADQNNFKKKGTILPVTEYNKNNKGVNLNSPTRPYHKIKTEAIGKQGLLKDKIRGLSFSSARRETTSKVFGWSTPGKLLTNGKRANGHSFVMDDDEQNNHITLETASGAKIKLDDTNGLIYIINKSGTSWFEMDDAGNVMIFGANDISFRARGNIDFFSDKKINIETKEYSLKSENISIESNTGNIKIADLITNTNNYDLKSTSVILNSSTLEIKSNNINLTNSGKLSLAGEVFASDFKTNQYSLNGHEHLYNPGPGSPTYTSAKKTGGGSSTSGPDAKDAVVKTTNNKTDILETFSDDLYMNRNTEEIQTIVERFVTFEPCPEHIKKGD